MVPLTMSELIQKSTNRILQGGNITPKEAQKLWEENLEELAEAADNIRQQLCGRGFDLCAIINGKSGRCGENCRFCAQSSHYQGEVAEYPLLPQEEIVDQGKKLWQEGIKRYSVVTSGRRLNKEEIAVICRSFRELKKTTGLRLCGSLGLLEPEDFAALKEAGMERCHNNLETAPSFFPEICTTHTYEEKIAAISGARQGGMEICSGGIIGMGETPGHRLEMAFALRELGVKSVPINILNPIKGTPLENTDPLSYEEIRRTVAVFRFILPTTALRLAGGRGLLEDKGKVLFRSGANAAISGDMLTTAGISTTTDLAMIKELGYEVKCCD